MGSKLSCTLLLAYEVLANVEHSGKSSVYEIISVPFVVIEIVD